MRRRVIRHVFMVLLFAISPVVAHAQEPSFDCDQAKTIAETLICESSTLSEQDRDLASWLRVAGIPKKDQQQWIMQRNRACGLPRSVGSSWLDRAKVIQCLTGVYAQRIHDVVGTPVQGANAPTRHPFLPKLQEDQAPNICHALLAAHQKSYLSANPEISAIDRPWPGMDVRWIFSPRLHGEDEGKYAIFKKKLDLDGNGKKQILALIKSDHGWRGMMYSLQRFSSDTAFQIFATKQEIPDEATGQSMLVRWEALGPIPWNWDVPAVLEVRGAYYLLDERSVSDDAAATLYRLSATKPPKKLCTILRVPTGDFLLPLQPKTIAHFADMTRIIGGNSHNCGSLNAQQRTMNRAAHLRAHAMVRPWAIQQGLTHPAQKVDGWLENWASEGVHNWDLYQNYLADQSQGLRDLAQWYRDGFGIAQASEEAARVSDLVLRNSFVFPEGKAVPAPLPLSLALLKGAPVQQVASLLPEADLQQKQYSYPLDTGEHYGELVPDGPLVLAIRSPQLVEMLLQAGAPVNGANSFGKTPLMYAAQYDQLETVQLLLKAGAHINDRTQIVHGCTLDIQLGGRTALHYAAANAGLPVIRALLQAGADRQAEVKGQGETSGSIPLDFLSNNIKLSKSDQKQAEELLTP